MVIGQEDCDWRLGPVTLQVPRRQPRGEDEVPSELPTDLESEGGSIGGWRKVHGESGSVAMKPEERGCREREGALDGDCL